MERFLPFEAVVGRTRSTSALRCTRGAGLVEYVVVLGLVAIVAIAGVRRFGASVGAKTTAQAACVTSLDCAGAGTPGAEGPSRAERLAAARQALISALLSAQERDGDTPDRKAAEAVADALLNGRTTDAARAAIRDLFGPLGVKGSTAAMDAIRGAGLMGAFLDATLRDKDGNPVDPRVRAAIERMMESGRLDVYAETLASTPVSVYDPTSADFAYANGNHHFKAGSDSDKPPRGVYFNGELLKSLFGDAKPGSPEYAAAVAQLSETMAHEVYHAYQSAHGGPDGAVNEGLGIAAIKYAYTSGDYNMSEMIYGTKSFYRDYLGQPDYPLNAVENADAELTELIQAFASRDSSHIAWGNETQLRAEYKAYWESHPRNDPKWNDSVEQATREMLEARTRNNHHGPR